MDPELQGVDLSPTARVPSVIEIGALIAGVLPFVVTSYTLSSETVNGRTVTWEYRDWPAIVCGCVTVLGAVVAAIQLRRTEPRKRLLRIAILVGLLALGAVQILRGIGRIGADRPEVVSREEAMAAVEKNSEGAAAKPAISKADIDATTRRLFAALAAGKTAEILEAAHPDLKKQLTPEKIDEIRHLPDARFGAFQKVDDKLAVRNDNGIYAATGQATYEKGKLDIVAEYMPVDGKPLLTHLNVEMADVTPEPAEAQKVTWRVLDGLLAGKIEDELFHPKLKENLAPDSTKQLAGLRAKIGKVKSIGPPSPRPCEDPLSKYCMEQAIVGSKRNATFIAELALGWQGPRLTAFHLNLDEPKKQR
jgi:hypothetical protein